MTESRVFAAGEHVFRTHDDSTLHYTVHGAGPLVVVLPPAWGIGSQYLQDGLASLYGGCTLLFLELRGNGKSSRPPASRMTSWHLAEDVEFLRQELKLEMIPCLMGHSGGGTVALWYAIRFPEKVQNLVLLNHQLEGFDDSESMKAILQQKQKDPKLRPALDAWTTSWDNASDEEFAAFFRTFLPVYFYDPKSCDLVPSLRALSSIPVWNYHLLHGKSASQRNQEAELDSVKARTLLIFATDDPICTPTQGMATKNGIAGSKLVLYDKCGHFPWIERKEEVIKELQEFFP
ncbi:unnamed protein product [Clonostachys solani]|uniref:AB hydrolase-1 domain-containing protein n=1 Tax=Clonostachys solani TaxID=160281 RepID=A0A9N9YX91_9HYPO|nr:unnamed protein product [Clonostachys solani]